MTTQAFSRRIWLRGLGVTMALPWLESRPLWSEEGSPTADQAPTRMAMLFSGCGFHSHEWWAKGEGASMELGKVLQPLNPLPRSTGLHSRPVQRRGPQGKHPQLADRQSALRRAAGGWRHDLDPAPASIRLSPSGWPADQTAESGARLRKGESVGAQELFDALQLAHFLEQPDDARRRWKSIRRWPSINCSRTSASTWRQERAGRRAGDAHDLRRTCSQLDQQQLDEYLNSVREVEQRIERAGKRGELQGWRPTLTEPNIPRPSDGYPQDIVEHMRSDVRHSGAGLSNRHDARLHAEAEQRPRHAAFSTPGCRLHDPPFAVAQRQRRLVEGQSVLPGTGRLHCPAVGRDPGRTADATG